MKSKAVFLTKKEQKEIVELIELKAEDYKLKTQKEISPTEQKTLHLYEQIKAKLN